MPLGLGRVPVLQCSWIVSPQCPCYAYLASIAIRIRGFFSIYLFTDSLCRSMR